MKRLLAGLALIAAAATLSGCYYDPGYVRSAGYGGAYYTQAAPVDDEPQTTLVFKDGQQLDVANYAIVGNTLYDLTPGHRRKIALAELDLSATAKENDGRGIDFQLPPSAKN